MALDFDTIKNEDLENKDKLLEIMNDENIEATDYVKLIERIHNLTMEKEKEKNEINKQIALKDNNIKALQEVNATLIRNKKEETVIRENVKDDILKKVLNAYKMGE